jgi:HEXXH motif-containing protein
VLPSALQAFVTGEDQLVALKQLRSAELSKHKLLLAAAMRSAAPVLPDDYPRVLAAPYQMLGAIERQSPNVVRELLGCPQFGAWADTCTRRLLAPAAEAAPDDVPLPFELGHLSVFAATAAIRSGQTFELDIPLRHGEVTFPSLGTARPGATAEWEWATVSGDASGIRVRSSVSTVPLPDGRVPPGGAADGWSAAPRVAIDAGDLVLDVVLDNADPYLDRYGIARAGLSADTLADWRLMIGQAWVILAVDHPWLARVVAATTRTLVPLARPGPTRSSSSTDIASFGAVALSLPRDALSMAEVLVHEAHHAVMGAMTDIEPLVMPGSAFVGYAPWRDDPRPAGALLQGIFAHFGMGRFWRERCTVDSPERRRRATAEFARLRMITSRAAETLLRSGALTGAGQELLTEIRAQLTSWLDQPVPSHATEYALDVSTDHEVRWRVRHLSPDPALVAALADAWRRGRPPPLSPDEVGLQLEPVPSSPPSANIRAYLLSLRYRDPEELRCWLGRPGTVPGSAPPPGRADPADAALVEGHYREAAVGYLRRIAAANDGDAWTGLAVSRRHTGPSNLAKLLVERPEVVGAVYDRIGNGARVDPEQVATWLAGA